MNNQMKLHPMFRKMVFPAACWLAVLALVLHGGLASAQAVARNDYPIYDLSVSFAPETNGITGTARIHLPRTGALNVELGALHVASLKVDGQRQALPDKRPLHFKSVRNVEIVYRGSFDELLDNDIRPGSIVLTDAWYPSIEGMAYYRLRARFPKDYVAVSEADSIFRTERNGMAEYRFDFPYPLNDTDGISLAASNRYEVKEEQHGGLLLQTYLKPETAERSVALLERAANLLDDYQARFGPYPYKRLAIVEAPLSSSLSMPTQVLLDQPAVKEDADKTPTLAHEIVHQWFGNTAYIDFDSGNWAEGAATYFADHELEHGIDNGWRCRKRILIGYLNRVRGHAELPLTRFSMREDDLSRWLGYGKSAYVYHMLRREIGDQAFYGGLRAFFVRYRQRVATWHDLQASFEQSSQRNLGWFFKQWVEEAGVAQLHAQATTRPMPDGRFEIRLEISQSGNPKRLEIPVTLRSAARVETHVFLLDKPVGIFNIATTSRPDSVVIDENYDVLRLLGRKERYPTIEQLQAEEHLVVVLPRGDPAPYRKVIDRIREHGKLFRFTYAPREFPGDDRRPLAPPGRALMRGWMKEAEQLSAADLANASLLILGRDNPVLARMFGKDAVSGPKKVEGFSLEVRINPDNPDRLVAVLDSASPEDTTMGLERVEKLGGNSFVGLADGEIEEKQTVESQRGIVVGLAPPIARESRPEQQRTTIPEVVQ